MQMTDKNVVNESKIHLKRVFLQLSSYTSLNTTTIATMITITMAVKSNFSFGLVFPPLPLTGSSPFVIKYRFEDCSFHLSFYSCLFFVFLLFFERDNTGQAFCNDISYCRIRVDHVFCPIL